MNLLMSIRRLLVPFPSAAAFSAREYWASRHQSHGPKLQAVGHRQLSEELNAEQYQIKRERIARCLRGQHPSAAGRRLLDAGCGSGVLTDLFVELGYAVTGVDFCEDAVTAARRRVPNASFVVSQLSELNLDRCFDVVTAVDVLLHVVDEQEWRETVLGLARHRNSQGVLLILDCLEAPHEKSPPHCRFRPLAAYTAFMHKLNLIPLLRERFELPHEGSWKDLMVFGSEADASPSRTPSC